MRAVRLMGSASRSNCSSAKASRQRRGWISAPTVLGATCASPIPARWRTWKRRRCAWSGLLRDALLQERSGRRLAAHLLEHLLHTRALREYLDRIARVRLVEGAGVHLQRGLGFAVAAQVFAQ